MNLLQLPLSAVEESGKLVFVVNGRRYPVSVEGSAPPVEEPPVEEPEEPPVEEPEEPPVEEPEEPAPQPIHAGVWLDQSELMSRPTSGTAWNAVVSAANSVAATGHNLSDQNSSHDLPTLAAALVAARTGDATMRSRAVGALNNAKGTEAGARWLAIGRNAGAYILAADILQIHDGPIYDWLRNLSTRTLSHNNSGAQITLRQSAWASGSNASAQEGFVHAALASYLDNEQELEWGWNAFRRYCGDRTSPHEISSNSDAWQEIPSDPVGIQNKGAVSAQGCNIDGAVSNDMSRGGNNTCSPGSTQYPWVGLNGAVLAALVYHRAGYPAFSIVDKALLRAATYLKNLGGSNWYDADSRADAKHIINVAYGVSYPVKSPVGASGLAGFTDWTHPAP